MDIEEYLENLNVDICALQDTKTNEMLVPQSTYERILFERSANF